MRSSWILHHRNRIWDQCLTARWMMWGTGTWMSWSIGFSYIQNCLRAKNSDSAVLPWLSYTSGYTFSRRFALFRCFRARTIANLNHVIMWFVFFWDITMADGFISYIAGVPHLVYISSMTFFFFSSLSLSRHGRKCHLQLAAWQRLIFTFCSQAYSMTCGQSVGERMRKAQCTHGIQHGNPHIQNSNDINITKKMVLEDLEDSPCRKFAIFFMPCSLLGFKKVMLNHLRFIMVRPSCWTHFCLRQVDGCGPTVDEALPGRLWEPSQLFWLVVDLPLWNIWKSVGMIIPKKWKNKKCSKPPTSIAMPAPMSGTTERDSSMESEEICSWMVSGDWDVWAPGLPKASHIPVASKASLYPLICDGNRSQVKA